MKKTKYKDSEIICLSKEDKTRVYKKRKHYNGYTKFEDLTAMVLLVGIVVALGAYVVAGLSKLIGFDLGVGWRIIVCASIILTLSVNIILRVKFMPVEDKLGVFYETKGRRVRKWVTGVLFFSIAAGQLWCNTQTTDAIFFNKQIDQLEGSKFMESITDGSEVKEELLITLMRLSSVKSKQSLVLTYKYYTDMWAVFTGLDAEQVDDFELELYTGNNEILLQKQEALDTCVEMFSNIMQLAEQVTNTIKEYSGDELTPDAKDHLDAVTRDVNEQYSILETQLKDMGDTVTKSDILGRTISVYSIFTLLRNVTCIYFLLLSCMRMKYEFLYKKYKHMGCI